MTIEFYSKIPMEIVLSIEDHLCGLEESNWVLLRVTEKDDYELQGYFESAEEGEIAWAEMCTLFPELPSEPQRKTIEDQDWKNAYKQYLKPWSSRGLHWVPIWEKANYPIQDGDVAIYFDAGMAFGTGAHETTRLCAERLLDYRARVGNEKIKQAKVIDAGCGSGILALSAAALGFGSVRGFDIDEEAIIVSKENAEDNNLAGTVKFEVSGLDEGLAKGGGDVVLANILANVLCSYKTDLIDSINPDGMLVLSGILKEEAHKVKSEFEQIIETRWQGYQSQTDHMGEWVDVVFFREA